VLGIDLGITPGFRVPRGVGARGSFSVACAVVVVFFEVVNTKHYALGCSVAWCGCVCVCVCVCAHACCVLCRVHCAWWVSCVSVFIWFCVVF